VEYVGNKVQENISSVDYIIHDGGNVNFSEEFLVIDRIV
jgi:hypothetical protein